MSDQNSQISTSKSIRIANAASVIFFVALGLLFNPSIPVNSAPLGASMGPNFAGSASGALWNNPANATGTNNNVCADSNGGALDLTNFGFSIPTGSAITGILVEPKANDAGGTYSVTLLKSGSATSATMTWTPVSTGCSVSTFAALGGAGNLWGTTWTPTDINAPTFGVRLAAGDAPAYIDAVRITVFFDPTIPTPPRPAEVPEADTLLLFGGGLGALATWVGWKWRKPKRTRP